MCDSISKETIKYITDLSRNNNRTWFEDHRNQYELAQRNAKDFMASLSLELNKHDRIEKSKLFRIYRDVRFSKDKTPYNPGFRMSFAREKPYLRGGYFLGIRPKETFLGAGFWNPAPADLKLIRDHIAQDDKPLRKLLKAKKFVDTFGYIQGDQVKSCPRGFSKDHPAIDLLRFKQLIVSKVYAKTETTAGGFAKQVARDFKVIRPFFDYMSDILGHDLNGEPLY